MMSRRPRRCSAAEPEPGTFGGVGEIRGESCRVKVSAALVAGPVLDPGGLAGRDEPNAMNPNLLGYRTHRGS
jgi:hypothetical protein